MLKGKSILVTAGGTQEFIDDVRVMTNTSTGATGAVIATHLLHRGASVSYVHGINAIKPPEVETLRCLPVQTASEAMFKMHLTMTASRVDAVVHCMAVSDFTFKRDKAIKCRSSDPQAFIDYMRETITLNPKIISMIKTWCPDTILIGFKYEVGATEEELDALAKESIRKNKCDLIVANDKKVIEATGTHAAKFIYAEDYLAHGFKNENIQGNDRIAQGIGDFLDAVLF